MARHQGKASTGRPVTQHQLFPAVVALWFGALLGLGSLVLRPSLIEALVIMGRIDLIVPAAAPPLGITARTILALGMASLGALIGTLIARRLARAGSAKHGPAASRAGAEEQPFAGQDAPTAEPGHTETATVPLRRRALAIEPDEAAFVPLEFAPLPGAAPQILDIEAIKADMRGFDGPAAAYPSEPPRQAFGQRLKAARELALATPDQLLEIKHPAEAEAASAGPEERQAFGLAPSNPAADKPQQISGEASQAAVSPAAASSDDAAPRPSLASLEMAELVTRLAESMQRRRAVRAAAGSAAEAAPGIEQSAALTADPRPAAFDPLDLMGFEEPAEAEAIPEGDYGSLLRISQAASRAGMARIGEGESSSPDIEPVVIFPGQAPHRDQPTGVATRDEAEGGGASSILASDSADQALRAALANLQRMSGAA